MRSPWDGAETRAKPGHALLYTNGLLSRLDFDP
jgi:hypothetical protein